MTRIVGAFQRLLQIGILATACAGKPAPKIQAPEPSRRAREIDAELRGVDLSDGVDANEARTIAEVYFAHYVNGCGATDDVVLHDRTWVVGLRFGMRGIKVDETIEVDAHSGGVSSAGGPRYIDFVAFRQGLGDATRDLH